MKEKDCFFIPRMIQSTQKSYNQQYISGENSKSSSLEKKNLKKRKKRRRESANEREKEKEKEKKEEKGKEEKEKEEKMERAVLKVLFEYAAPSMYIP